MFDTDRLQKALRTSSLGREAYAFESLPSTNDYLKQFAALMPAGSVCVAEAQTQGRGRAGRAWATHPGLALALSVLLKPVTIESSALLPLACAIAARRALAPFCGGAPVAVKWPNDIVAQHDGRWRKLCGILCEGVAARGERAVVCGFGVNLAQGEADFAPPEGEALPYAVSAAMLGGKAPDPERAAAALLTALEPEISRLLAGGEAACLRAYRRHCVNIGRAVRFTRDGWPLEGVVTGVGDDGALLVETAGHILELHAGDVSVRGVYDYV